MSGWSHTGDAAKSISAETTFNTDLTERAALERQLWRLAEKLARRLREKELAAGGVVLKLKTAGFALRTRNQRLPLPTQLPDLLFEAARALLQREADGTAFRLIGIGAQPLVCGGAGGSGRPGGSRGGPAGGDAAGGGCAARAVRGGGDRSGAGVAGVIGVGGLHPPYGELLFAEKGVEGPGAGIGHWQGRVTINRVSANRVTLDGTAHRRQSVVAWMA